MLDARLLAPDKQRGILRREYERMVEIGMFEDDKLELLEGCLVTMSPQGTYHATALRRLAQFLLAAVNNQQAEVQVQSPLALSNNSEPEPDIAIVPAGNYWHTHPNTALIAIEIAESSITKDRSIKACIYAQANIPEYWIVNLTDGVFEVFTQPAGNTYSEKQTYRRNEEFDAAVVSGIRIRVNDFLPDE